MNAFFDSVAPGRDISAAVVLSMGHFLWQGALVAVLGALVARQIRTANGRYLAHVATLALMMLCPLATFSVFVADLPAPRVATSAPAPRNSPPVVTVPTAIPTAIVGTAPSGPVPTPRFGPSPQAVVPSIPASTPQTTVRAEIDWQNIARMLTNLYLSGVAVMFLRLMAGLWGGWRLRRSATPVWDVRLLVTLQEQAESLGLAFIPSLAYCERVTVPTVIGILRPTILLPVALVAGLAPAQIEAILAHELAHLRRYDHLVNLFQRVVESVLFFHPALWWVSGRIRVERENCCDDLVVACGAIPLDYAESLLRVAELSHGGARRQGAIAAVSLLATGGKPSTLRQRIARLLGDSSDSHVRFLHRWPVLLLGMLCVLMAWTVTHNGLNSMADEPKQEQKQDASKEKPSKDAGANVNENDIKPQNAAADVMDEFGPEAHGLRCRLVAVSAATDDEEPDASRAVREFANTNEATFLVELKNVSDKPVTLLGVRYGDSYPTAAGKLNTEFFAPHFFEFEFTDKDGKPLPRAKRVFERDAMLVDGASAHVVPPGGNLKVLLRPSKFHAPMDYQLPPGKYNVKVRYHGPEETALALIKKHWPDKAQGNAWSHEAVSNSVPVEVNSIVTVDTSRELDFVPAEKNSKFKLSVRNSRILRLPKKIRLVDGHDPKVIVVTQIGTETSRIRFTGVAPGTTKVTVIDEDHEPYVIQVEVADLVWGPVVDGLQAAMEIRVPNSVVGDPSAGPGIPIKAGMSVHFHIKNVSDKPITFASETSRQDDYAHVKDAAGKEVPVQGTWFSGVPIMVRWTLQPGEISEQQVLSPAINQLEQPGQYTVSYTVRFNGMQSKDDKGNITFPLKGDWQKELETGAVPLVLRARTAEDDARAKPPTFTGKLEFVGKKGPGVESGVVTVRGEVKRDDLIDKPLKGRFVDVPDCTLRPVMITVRADGYEEAIFYEVKLKPDEVKQIELKVATPSCFKVLSAVDGKPLVGAKGRFFNKTSAKASAGPIPMHGLEGPVWAVTGEEGLLKFDSLQKVDPYYKDLGDALYYFCVEAPPGPNGEKSPFPSRIIGPVRAGKELETITLGPPLDVSGEIHGTAEELKRFAAEWDQPLEMKSDNPDATWIYAVSKTLETNVDGDKLTFHLTGLAPGKLRFISNFGPHPHQVSHTYARRDPKGSDVVVEVELKESMTGLVLTPQGRKVAKAATDNNTVAAVNASAPQAPAVAAAFISPLVVPPAVVAGADVPLDADGQPLPKGMLQKLGSARFKATGWWRTVAFAEDGEWIWGKADERAFVMHRQTGYVVDHQRLGLGNGYVQSVAISPSGKLAAIGMFEMPVAPEGTTYRLVVLDARTAALKRSMIWKGKFGDLRCLAFKPDDTALLAATSQGDIRLWDVAQGTQIRQETLEGAELWEAAYSPGGETVVLTGMQRSYFWKLAEAGPPSQQLQPGNPLRHLTVCFAPNGKWFATGANEQDGISLWNGQDGSLAAQFKSGSSMHPDGGLTFSPDSQLLAAPANSGVELWDVDSRKLTSTLPAGTSRSVTISRDGQWLACTGSSAAIEVYNLPERKLVGGASHGHGDPVRSIRFAGEGLMVSTAADKSLCLWDVKTGKLRDSIGLPGEAGDVAVSRDGHSFVANMFDNTIGIWDLATFKRLTTRPGHGDRGGARAAKYSADGSRFVTWGDDMELRWWNANGTPVSKHSIALPNYSTPQAYPRPQLLSGLFSEDARSLFILFESKLYEVNTANGQIRRTEQVPGVEQIAVSPDGRWLAVSQVVVDETGDRHTQVNLHELSTFKKETEWRLGGVPIAEGDIISVTPPKNPGDSQILSISLGHDDGMREGHALTVYRTSPTGKPRKHLGSIRITQTTPDTATAVLSHRVGEEGFQVGDHVSTITLPVQVAALQFSPDSRQLAWLEQVDATAVKIVDVDSKTVVSQIPLRSTAWTLQFTPDGQRIATGSYDTTISLWDPRQFTTAKR